MSNRLPFFKFEPVQWDNGNIQIVSREQKGLFIDLCSLYWSRRGELPFKLAVQKLCAGNATALESLCDDGIFEVIGGMVCINFLNEQLQFFRDESTQNSKNAKEGWEKRRQAKEFSARNATASNPQSENDANKNKSKNKEEDNTTGKSSRFVPPTVEEVSAYCLSRGNTIDAQAFVSFYESKGWLIGKNKMKDWKQAIITWERSRTGGNASPAANVKPTHANSGDGTDWDAEAKKQYGK